LLVLTSRLSASASEILAGALQDYGRAIIAGDTSTFGKGTVQTIVPLARVMQAEGLVPDSDPGALKVTISKFYRPSGKSTQLEGVKADIVIPSLTDVPEIGESDLANPLPWDTLPAAAYKESNRVQASLEALRSHSEQRVAKDPDFADLKNDIERFRKLRADKAVSLNEAKRQQEKTDLKKRQAAIKKDRLARAVAPPAAYQVTLKDIDRPGPGEPVKPKAAAIDPDADADAEVVADPVAAPAEDIVLHEAEHILLDYAASLENQPSVSKR